MTRVLIIGGGIVGTALALELAGSAAEVAVLDASPGESRGSTAFAPGFIGVFNEAPVLTGLARTSVEIYTGFADAFAVRGGVELATTDAGAARLQERAHLAAAAGLSAEYRDGPELPAEVRDIVDRRIVVGSVSYSGDAVADPAALRRLIEGEAVKRGARFHHGVTAVGIGRQTGAWRVRTSAETDPAPAEHVVLAGGIWAPSLGNFAALDLPVFPVAHPYVYAAAGAPRVGAGPFLRWPEHHVYARTHGDVLGIGSYDHPPMPIAQDALGDGAGRAWDPVLDDPIARAQELLSPRARFTPSRRINGVFSMTPDNLPFLGRHPRAAGLWVAEAIWVTHAGGAARMLARAILEDAATPPELAVDRFAGGDPASLRAAALRLYRDIYANEGTVGS